MCSLYYLTRPQEETRKILGAEPSLGEIYLPSDPPRMFRSIRRPGAALLRLQGAGGQPPGGQPGRGPALFEEAFAHLKPSDGVIVGMDQQFGDQVGDDAAIIRDVAARNA